MRIFFLAGLLFASLALSPLVAAADTLADTEPLTWEGDLAARMVADVDRFLLRKLDESVGRRAAHWQRDYTSPDVYHQSVEPQRKRLAHLLGVRDERQTVDSLELVATTSQPALLGQGDGFKIFQVRWPVLRNFHGEGLLLVPDKDRRNGIDVVALPDADHTPELIVGLADGLASESQFARRLAESGCRVVVPMLVSRELQRRAPPGQAGRANLTNREYLYRSAYELGRHLIGYEVQETLALVDWFQRDAAEGQPPRGAAEGQPPRVAVIGYGEGGMLALYAGALDPRIHAVGVSGYFGPRERIWEQPIDRNVFALLEQFGDAEVASLVAPRTLVLDGAAGPELTLPSEGGAPAVLRPVDAEAMRHEVSRLRELLGGPDSSLNKQAVVEAASVSFCDSQVLTALLHGAREGEGNADELAQRIARTATSASPPKPVREPIDQAARQTRKLKALDEHNQWLLSESPYARTGFMNIGLTSHDRADGGNKLDASSPEAYEKSIERFRDIFRHEVVGHFDDQPLPFHARSRKTYDADLWTGYEVVLDVFPDVFAYGILCMPKGMKPDERRPVVVCQHGLEGRPQDVVTGNHPAYHDFASKLAERGFITFSPQNLYIGKDDFRTLQRKAYPLKKTLFSVIVPQHQQIVDWLKTLPNVDADRIGFYGLSYGGKSAMRIPALVTDYSLSICSADFNEWVWKNASTRAPHSYVWTGEYEIFEWDLGSTYNYAEMAGLIAPRPFMVERGHFDGVAPDDMVGFEFAKVRHLFAARLKLPERCEIEWFVGPHTINGQGTFSFLHRHLNHPAEPKSER